MHILDREPNSESRLPRVQTQRLVRVKPALRLPSDKEKSPELYTAYPPLSRRRRQLSQIRFSAKSASYENRAAIYTLFFCGYNRCCTIVLIVVAHLISIPSSRRRDQLRIMFN
ncbi:hypothetical protein PUN28_018907 [Cardiocondyla obscurior]|uniref:Uncharacterized protein n=1 Tax=Cardiocondyla obscurior TaxID=286306 RepID=A0AAW2EGH7_9HYME